MLYSSETLKNAFINYKKTLFLFFIILSSAGLATAHETAETKSDTCRATVKGSCLSLFQISYIANATVSSIKLSHDARFVAGVKQSTDDNGAVPGSNKIYLWKNEPTRSRLLSIVKLHRTEIDLSSMVLSDMVELLLSHLPQNVIEMIYKELSEEALTADLPELARLMINTLTNKFENILQPASILDFSFNGEGSQTGTIITSSSLGLNHHSRLTGSHTESTSHLPSFLNQVSDNYLYMANVRSSEDGHYSVDVYQREDKNEDEYTIISTVMHAAPVNALAFSHDNKFLASASDDHTIEIMDLSAVTAEVIHNELPVKQVFFDSEGNIISMNGEDEHRIFIHKKYAKWTSHEVILKHQKKSPIKSIAVHTRSNALAVVYTDNDVQLFERANDFGPYQLNPSFKLPAKADQLVFSRKKDVCATLDTSDKSSPRITFWKLLYTK